MNPSSETKLRTELDEKILNAIKGALREEKEPLKKRVFKILSATLVASLICVVPFVFSFRGQLGGVWSLTIAFWLIYFLIGFTLLFKPQPRLMISGLWSPFVIARLFLVSTFATVIEVIICPSFVFLSSPLGWNPLTGLTQSLMQIGGMGLCMGFCGFLFATISAGLGIAAIHKAARSPDGTSVFVISSILLASQIPILFVQVASEGLREFSGFWVIGTLIGLFVILGPKWAFGRFRLIRLY